MTASRPSYIARVVRLYLEDPDTPVVPSKADWEIAADLFNRNVPIETIHLAFKLALIRRRRSSNTSLPPIRSLAYFRAVALNLSAEETEPGYAEYVDQLYEELMLDLAYLKTAL